MTDTGGPAGASEAGPDAASARVRVTGAASPRASPGRTATGPVRIDGESDVALVYARGLVRAQLLLAVGCLVGFVVCAGILAAALLALPALDQVIVWGVPLPWLLHAYGFYPIIVVFALIYVRSAARNERRFRQLKDAS